MGLTNKTFKDNKTGASFKIIDSYKDVAITDKNERIDSSRLLDIRYYTEQIDPKSFFNDQGVYSAFAEKIKGIDLSKIPDNEVSEGLNNDDSIQRIEVPRNDGFTPATNESAVLLSDPEYEMEELKRKYGAVSVDESAIKRQSDAFSKLLNDDEPTETPSVIVSEQKHTENVKVDVSDYRVPKYVEPPVVKVEDPITTMFKGVKRSVDFSFELNMNSKIPRLDFIEMMEDSYEFSIIDYLADEFTKEILKDPNTIRDSIRMKIKNLVYPNKENKTDDIYDEVVPKKKKPTRKKTTKSDDTGIIS